MIGWIARTASPSTATQRRLAPLLAPLTGLRELHIAAEPRRAPPALDAALIDTVGSLSSLRRLRIDGLGAPALIALADAAKYLRHLDALELAVHAKHAGALAILIAAVGPRLSHLAIELRHDASMSAGNTMPTPTELELPTWATRVARLDIRGAILAPGRRAVDRERGAGELVA